MTLPALFLLSSLALVSNPTVDGFVWDGGPLDVLQPPVSQSCEVPVLVDYVEWFHYDPFDGWHTTNIDYYNAFGTTASNRFGRAVDDLIANNAHDTRVYQVEFAGLKAFIPPPSKSVVELDFTLDRTCHFSTGKGTDFVHTEITPLGASQAGWWIYQGNRAATVPTRLTAHPDWVCPAHTFDSTEMISGTTHFEDLDGPPNYGDPFPELFARIVFSVWACDATIDDTVPPYDAP